MTQLDLFAPACTSPHVQWSTRPYPPQRLVATDPELWEALAADTNAPAFALVRRRHPGDPDAQAAALEAVRGPTSYRGPVLDGWSHPGARYGRAVVLAHLIHQGREATA